MERQVCSPEHVCPNPPTRGERWAHPQAVEIDEDSGSLADGGSYVKYECPLCKNIFWVNLPD